LKAATADLLSPGDDDTLQVPASEIRDSDPDLIDVAGRFTVRQKLQTIRDTDVPAVTAFPLNTI
jgi:hypothetical protein